MGLDIYRVGFVGDAPPDARLRELIKENAFAPYHLHFPHKRR